ncbi:Crp/Fnr family transcriptional regulator [Candidatus Endoriftia persephone str. Guaymas]|jgi:CRP/FNR family transcriptional regulator|uniref:Transcriptional regulator, Crp/Fnr family n=3 Tax=Gammaproteobacteria TaxID=1236 RepID=G2FHU9_9GAMM|nr:Crp/Fnr family transcriptional regulator [Candidatus Endoriftia persephone]EGV51788.1 transcriptional regulator, Crp/Fnr family [endosymbiont of Riftia pachyptila (vent Ph05)]EGW53628.1 transcriptional regulator, Crp/Fnr family [endosymbiont of Tevnia jerichonana (vent Tica)]MBA1333165.1 Crp/Fnr family transcriptional regulator [Candidatus Endoriftia persephone str. Guaymas]USF88370.1 Crp/Fnr family transcriptional regulator [Candidatus Endoriftia persephone]
MISDPQTIAQIRQRFPFLPEPEDELMRHFLAHSNLVRLDPQQPICQEGMQCSHLALVLSGTARVFKLGENGREITLYRVGPGESCILTASCIISQRPFPAFAVCEEALEAVVIPAAEIQQWMERYPPWRAYLFGLVSERLGDVISIIEAIAFQRVDRRIASLLLKRATSGNSRQIHLTHQEIASDLGTSREVVSRILKEFESRGMIHASRGHIDLSDLKALEEKAQEQ